VPPADHVVDHLHGAGTVERVERGQVLQAVRLEAAQDVAHAVGLELEQPEGLARREQLVGPRVVERDLVGLDAGPRLASIIFTQSSMSVSVRRPRKSIFRRPMRSTPCMSYWVVRSAVLPLNEARGTNSVSGSGAMTTPAAWVEAWRVVPSRRREMSMSSLTRESFW
jgi:hypothetical protein